MKELFKIEDPQKASHVRVKGNLFGICGHLPAYVSLFLFDGDKEGLTYPIKELNDHGAVWYQDETWRTPVETWNGFVVCPFMEATHFRKGERTSIGRDDWHYNPTSNMIRFRKLNGSEDWTPSIYPDDLAFFGIVPMKLAETVHGPRRITKFNIIPNHQKKSDGTRWIAIPLVFDQDRKITVEFRQED